MPNLVEILGRNIMSAEAAAELARYPLLRPDPDEDDIDVRYLRSERDGLLIKLSGDGDVLAVFFMSAGKDGFSQYRGELPEQLEFHNLRGEVLKRLGAPAFNRPAGKLGVHATGELFRFDRPDYSLHLQFRPDRNGIELVTVMVAAIVPGRSVAQDQA